MTTKNGKNKLIYWLAGIIIILVGAAYGDIKSDFADAKTERKEFRTEIKELRGEVNDFAQKAIATSTHVGSLTDRIEKTENVVEKLRNK